MQKSRPTQNKRQRERALQDRRKATNERRLAAKARRAAEGPRSQNGEDPDIAGIRPGPQQPYDFVEDERFKVEDDRFKDE